MTSSNRAVWWGALCAWLSLLASAAARADEQAVYVSPTGNDAWSGTLAAPNAQKSDGPVASPQRAGELARALRARQGDAGPVHVYLRGGTYYLREPLVLTPADSGTAQAPVVWCAYQKERPVLSGGRRLTGWARTRLNNQDVYVTKLAGGDEAPVFRELWIEGKRLNRARWPKQGTLTVASLSDNAGHDSWSKGVTEFRYGGDDLKAWPTAQDGEVILACRWAESHLPISSIDEQAHVIRFGKRSVFRPDPGDRYWVENVRECLTEAGTFAVDARAKSVYLIPPPGVDPNRAEVVAPCLAQVMRLVGDPATGRYVEHVTFRGLGFAHTEWYFDHPVADREARSRPEPLRSGFSQAAVGVPGAIWGQGVRSCTFDACTVAHTGTYGVELSRGCRHNRITRCTLTDLGAGGVKLGETSIRTNESEQTFGNEVADCTITDGGNLFPSCVAVWVGQAHDNTIAHNDIHGFWYTAVSVGWTWGYGPSIAQRNIIESNHIHHIGVKADGDQPILSDMGCVYTLGNQEGSVVRGNRFHDVVAFRYGGWGIYFDEGSTHILAENNLVYRTTHGGFHQHYGKENTVRNNVLAFGRDAQIQRTRIEGHQSFRFEHNLVLWQRGPLLAGDWSKPAAAFDGNTYWREEPGAIRFGKGTWEQWQEVGLDRNSRIADPHLANPTAGDFRLTAMSRAALAGFEPFDLATVGPR